MGYILQSRLEAQYDFNKEGHYWERGGSVLNKWKCQIILV